MAVSLLERARRVPVSASIVILASIIGAIAPDLDILYFYLIDNRQTHHHKYITHWPIAWLVLLVISTLWLCLSKNKKSPFVFLVFSLGGILHVVLDSLVGDIWWFAPFLDKPYALFTVPAIFKPWWLNFILHWSFAAEIAICFWALLIYRRRSNNSIQPTPASGRG